MALSVSTLITSTQDGVVALLVPFVSATFNVAASSILVLTEGFESDPNNTPVITWTGGTPAGASAWTKQVDASYQDGVGDTQGATCWTAYVNTAQTGVSVTHTNSVNIVNGIVLQLVVRQVTGGASAPLLGATGVGPNTSASGTINVTTNAQQALSMILGVVGTANSSTSLTVASGSTTDSNSSLPTAGAAYLACHATSLTAGSGNVTIGATNTNTFRIGAAIEIRDGSRSQSETATATDAVTAAQGFSATLLETASPTDAYTASSPATGVSDSESASASDVFSSAAGFAASQAESATASEAFAALAGFASSEAESTAASLTLAAAMGMPASQAESASPTDSYALQLAIAAQQAESTSCSVSFAAAQGFAVTYLEATSPSVTFDDGAAPAPGSGSRTAFWPWWYRTHLPLNRRRIM